jgi:thymidylate synthase
MLCQQCELEPGEVVISTGDSHIYSNHFEQVATQLEREPRALPTLRIKRKPESIYDYRFDDFEIAGYEPHAHIAGAVAV